MKHFMILMFLFLSIGAYADDFSNGFRAFENNDFVKAKEFFEKACNNGYSAGCTNLGSMYETGTGVNQDFLKAFSLYETACNRGKSYGCFKLGIMYSNGRGINKNSQKALELFRKACDMGEKQGCKYYDLLKKELGQ